MAVLSDSEEAWGSRWRDRSGEPSPTDTERLVSDDIEKGRAQIQASTSTDAPATSLGSENLESGEMRASRTSKSNSKSSRRWSRGSEREMMRASRNRNGFADTALYSEGHGAAFDAENRLRARSAPVRPRRARSSRSTVAKAAGRRAAEAARASNRPPLVQAKAAAEAAKRAGASRIDIAKVAGEVGAAAAIAAGLTPAEVAVATKEAALLSGGTEDEIARVAGFAAARAAAHRATPKEQIPSPRIREKREPPKADEIVEKGSDAVPQGENCEMSASLEDLPHELFDIVIVTPKVSTTYRQELLEKAVQAGFVVDTFESILTDNDHPNEQVTFLNLALPPQRGETFAQAIQAPRRMDPMKLRAACKELDPPICFEEKAESGLSFAEITRRGDLFPPFLHIYGEFTLEKRHLFMPINEHSYHKLVLRLLEASIEFPDEDGMPCPRRGCGFNVRAMQNCYPETIYVPHKKESQVATVMLLHESIEDYNSLRSRLHRNWILGSKGWSLPWNVPINDIRDYFGDQIGFFFLFRSTFATHCLPVGFVGLILSGMTWSENVSEEARRQAPAMFLAPVMFIMMVVFLAHFRRKQANFAKLWGCFSWLAAKPRVRPTYWGEYQPDAVDGHIIKHYPHERRSRRQALSWCFVVFTMCCLVGTVHGLFEFLNWTQNISEWETWRQEVFGGKNVGYFTFQALYLPTLAIYDMFLYSAAKWLTIFENHETDDRFAHEWIAKYVAVRFVNCFAAPYYIAFIISPESCRMYGGDGGCVHALTHMVSPVFFMRMCVTLAKMAWMRFMQMIARMKISGDAGKFYEDRAGVPKRPAREMARRQFAELTTYDAIIDPIEDCLTAVLDFSTMVCFGTAFPLSPFVVFIANVIYTKVDGYKLLWLKRRVMCMEVTSIGVWEHIYEAILLISIPTNMGICIFTSKIVDDLGGAGYKWPLFIVGCIFLLFIKQLTFWIFPPTSQAVAVQTRREATYNARVIRDISVDDVFNEIKPVQDPQGSQKLLNATHDSAFG